MFCRPLIAGLSMLALIFSAWTASWHVHSGHQHGHADHGPTAAAHSHAHLAQGKRTHCHHASHHTHAATSSEASREQPSNPSPWGPTHSHDDCQLCQFLAQHFGLIVTPVTTPIVEQISPLACADEIRLFTNTVQLVRSRGPPARV